MCMHLLYNIGIWLFGVGVKVAARHSLKARRLAEGWRHSFDNLSRLDGRKVAWFHAASLGEFEQARPVLEQFRLQHPDYAVCLTFFSPSGYEIRKDYKGADIVAYLPLDTPHNARRFMRDLHPQVAFFVKYEFWFNILRQLKVKQVPTYLFSAIFRPGQYFFKWYGAWYRRQLQCFSHIFVQNEESERLLRKAGIGRVSQAGDTRFDRVCEIAQKAPRREEVERFVQDKAVVMAGSSWLPDEERLCRFLKQCGDNVRMVLAPHEIDEEHLLRIEELFAGETVRYTRLSADTRLVGKRVLIVDTMGMLSSLYRYATVAYVGGGFGKGIHNILEALAFGKPVVFGPNYGKFQEARDIIAIGGGIGYEEDGHLFAFLNDMLAQSDAYQAASKKCYDYIHNHSGATNTILSAIKVS
ncbi:MAG: glycosyltransferase N-terminal domain-containing protein [Bacteroidales bacterium]|nr:glycosyltransferase N-terminal domain-containing protein [Bacteroidales bacterium]